jgi:hypothetical protein
MPTLTGATTPSLSRYSFFGPVQSAAVLDSELEMVEDTSLKIAIAILEGHHQITDRLAVAQLLRHLDLLENGPPALDAVAWSPSTG